MNLQELLAQVSPLVVAGAAYAGIGSRETPVSALQQMTRIAERLRERGMILRSGRAPGADSAFEQGAGNLKEIYRPWATFNGSSEPFEEIPPAAFKLAVEFHPLRHGLLARPAVHRLMARNCQQILGADLKSPAKFAICWTPDGADGVAKPTSSSTGGTGQAIRICAAFGVPVINLRPHFAPAAAPAADNGSAHAPSLL